MSGSLVRGRSGAHSVPLRARDPGGKEWQVLAGTGIALLLVGWTDLLLLWYPLNFGNVDWEFGTVTAFFNGLPLATIGFALVACAAVARESRGVLLALALLAAVIDLGFLGTAGLFALTLTQAWSSVTPEMHLMLGRSLAKTSVLMITYILLYAWLGWMSARAWSAQRERTPR